MAKLNQRKKDHVRLIQDDNDTDRRKFYFDDIQLTHRALPELDLNAIDTTQNFLGKDLRFPLLISSMTGGNDAKLKVINENLAKAAQETGIAMGVGSQRVMFKDKAARASFALRGLAPDVPLLANFGAVQLNDGFGIDACKEAVDVLDADALILHLNPLQEAVQPEGDTDFSGLADKIAAIAAELEQPLILKEVGAGISAADVERVIGRGVEIIDVAGSGGTSWSRVEQLRSENNDDLGFTFQDWGIPTPEALMALEPYQDRLTLIASGGIRNGIDMAKAIILGADLCGMASPFLAPAVESADAVVAVIKRLEKEFRTAMFLLGVADVAALKNNRNLIRR